MPNVGHKPGPKILGSALLCLLLTGAAGCSVLENRAALFGDPPGSADSSPPLDLPASKDLASEADLAVAPLPPDIGICPNECINGCIEGVCQLDCSNGCACPRGYACKVECKGDSCHGTIDCTVGKSCSINCDNNACNLPINCGDAACTIGCFQGSCNDPIQCGSGGCKITCSDRSCQNLIRCEKGRCDILCTGSSCKGSIDCGKACACSLACNNASCDRSRIDCLPGCKYIYSTGCSVSSKYPWCNNC